MYQFIKWGVTNDCKFRNISEKGKIFCFKCKAFFRLNDNRIYNFKLVFGDQGVLRTKTFSNSGWIDSFNCKTLRNRLHIEYETFMRFFILCNSNKRCRSLHVFANILNIKSKIFCLFWHKCISNESNKFCAELYAIESNWIQ